VPEQGLHRQRFAAMPVAAVALAPRRPALAAVHAADALAAHRRLPTGPVVMLAARLAARRIGRVAAPVAVPERPKGHGVNLPFRTLVLPRREIRKRVALLFSL